MDLQLDVTDDIATITFDRPPVNALSGALLHDLAATFHTLADMEELAAVVIRASGRVFCAGIDLKEKASEADSGNKDGRLRAGAELEVAMGSVPVPIVCAVNGAALGGGLAICLMSDLLIASDDASFGFTDIDVGMIGGAGLLVRYLPLALSRKMLYTAERLDAHRAHALGLVDSVVAREELWAEAAALAASIASRPRGAVRATKNLLGTAELIDWESQLRLENRQIRQYVAGIESKNATDAFVSRKH